MRNKLLFAFSLFSIIGSAQLTENFDNNGTNLPTGWTNEYVVGSTDWKVVQTNQNSTVTPLSPVYMAEFRKTDWDSSTKLIIPVQNISGMTTPTLNFSYVNRAWSGDVDELRVFYKASATGAWTQIGSSYTTEATTWTQVSLPLPDKTATYYIAFEGKSNYARGLDLDNVSLFDASNLSTTEVTNSKQFKIYPNPIKDILFVQTDEKLKSLEVFSLSGVLVKSFDGKDKKLNLSDLPKGVYLLRIKGDGYYKSYKIVKE